MLQTIHSMMPSRPTPARDAHQHLALVPLFEGLSPAIVNHFAEKSVISQGDKGRVLYVHGEEADHFYVIISGWVKLFRETLEGAEAVLDILSEGQSFGTSNLYGDGTYSCSAQIIDKTRYIVLPTSLLRYYIEKEPRMAINMLAQEAAARRMQMREIEHLNVQTAPQRIGCFLLRLCDEDAQGEVVLHLPYDKTLIAARLGMKPETFSRALASLKKETGLGIHGGTITIRDVSALSEYTCSHCSSHFPCEDIQEN